MQLPKDKKYTYSDYLTWDDNTRYELIDGVPYMMSAPSPTHQRISVELATQLRTYLRGKRCEVFPAPFDVRLNADQENNTVVQPDISVICDPNKIDERGCKGAPDMVIEILSPSTALYDQNTKFDKYLEAGVKEYWLVSPDERKVHVYLFKRNEGTFRVYKDAATIPVYVLEDCQISLTSVFPPEHLESPEDNAGKIAD